MYQLQFKLGLFGVQKCSEIAKKQRYFEYSNGMVFVGTIEIFLDLTSNYLVKQIFIKFRHTEN